MSEAKDATIKDVLEHELKGNPARSERRLVFPLIRIGVPGSLRITPGDIRRVEEEDDLRRTGRGLQ